jgi:iron complex transport system substrate-binding protein
VHRFRFAFILGPIVVAACSSPQQIPLAHAKHIQERPKRIVSLDYCADQFVLKLAQREDILALSPDATREFSFLRKQAIGLPFVRPNGEDVVALAPDLVVRSYGGGPNAQAFFEQAGIKVHQIGWGEDFDGVRANIREAANAMGQGRQGEATISDFDARLAKLKPAAGVSALYLTSGGVTTGPGTMIDLMMTTAGLSNFQTQKGWNQLPLEHLAAHRPDMAVTAFFGAGVGYEDYWSSARHPIARNLLKDLPVAELDGSTTACAGWFIMDAIEVLAAQGHAVAAQKGSKT